jgi:superfamily II DNA or RNA helicase
MFTDWNGWLERNGHYMRGDGELWEGNALIKKHAIMQTINNPDYIGSQAQSPKHEEVRKVVEECLEEGRKVLIFTKYIHEANTYMEMLRGYGPAMLTGEISAHGDLTNADGSPRLFRYSQTKGFELDERGYPIDDAEGRPISALTYERLTFMHSPERRVMISTYGTGGVGITLNAAKAVVLADPPETYTEFYQALNRVERMDTPETRTHHDVRIYRIASRYPEEFMELMKDTYIKRIDGRYEEADRSEALDEENGRLKEGYTTAYDEFFRQGTYDMFAYRRIENQRIISGMLLDGIISEEEAAGPGFQGA